MSIVRLITVVLEMLANIHSETRTNQWQGRVKQKDGNLIFLVIVPCTWNVLRNCIKKVSTIINVRIRKSSWGEVMISKEYLSSPAIKVKIEKQ